MRNTIRGALLGVFLALTTSGMSHADQTYTSSAAARSAMESATQEIQQRDACINRAHDEMRKHRDEEVAAWQELNELAKQKKRTLEELLSGRFCSRCKRAASEIERQMKIPFEKHLTDVKGIGIPAPRELFEQKKREYNEQMKRVSDKMFRAERERKQSDNQAYKCSWERQQAREKYYVAEFWAGRLAAEEGAAKRAALAAAPSLDGARFGLGNNTQTSDYRALRAYYEKGKVPGDSVKTLSPNAPIAAPDDVEKIREHKGIDISSRDAQGNVVPLPFSAGFSGRARYIGGNYNLIQVELPNGSILEFLHASVISQTLLNAAQNGNGWVSITANDTLGRTGGKGPNGAFEYPTHLHIQAKEPVRDDTGKITDYRETDPRLAVLPSDDPRRTSDRQARQNAERDERRATGGRMTFPPLAPIPGYDLDYMINARRTNAPAPTSTERDVTVPGLP